MEAIWGMLVNWVLTWPTWRLIRAFGLTAYVFLFIAVFSALVARFPFLEGRKKSAWLVAHHFSAWLSFFLVLAHAFLLMVDTYAPFAWEEILLPFLNARHPIAYGLGILSAYGLLFVLLTTDLASWLGKTLWRRFHLLSYPTYVLSLVHGLLAGTDAQVPWVTLLYGITGGMIALLLFLHAMQKRYGGKRSAYPVGRR